MSDNKEKEEEKPVVAKTAVDLQRLKLMKLMKNPEKPVLLPERPKSKNTPTVPEFVRNVMGSSAGAGSGEFHVYRHLRRKEYARQKFIQEKGRKELLDDEYHLKLEENKRKAEEITAKKRAKRLKKKQKWKQKKRTKTTNSEKDNTDDHDDSEESSDQEEVNDVSDAPETVPADDNKDNDTKESSQTVNTDDKSDESINKNEQHSESDKNAIDGSSRLPETENNKSTVLKTSVKTLSNEDSNTGNVQTELVESIDKD